MSNYDVLDGPCLGKPMKDETDGEINNRNELADGTAYMAVEKNARFYKMDHKKQGVAYIFNHEKFDMEKCDDRHGTDVDVEKLNKCLKAIGFEVHKFKDLKLNDIQLQMDQAVRMDHTNNNCFLLVVLTHGSHDILCARDKLYKPEEVFWDRLTPDKCKTLAGKPKLFFLQSCQGMKTDPGIKLVERPLKTETDGPAMNYKIPIYADFLLIYATFKGHYAFRKSDTGSYFITVLSEELVKFAYQENLLTILTFINQRVALEFESYNIEKPQYHGKRQIPYFKCSLTRLMQFIDLTALDNNNSDSVQQPKFISRADREVMLRQPYD